MKKSKYLSRILGPVVTVLTMNLTTSAIAASQDAPFTVDRAGSRVVADISYHVVDLSDHGDSQITYGIVYLYQAVEDGRNRLISKTEYQVVPSQLTFSNLPIGDYYLWVNVGGAHDGEVNVAANVRN